MKASKTKTTEADLQRLAALMGIPAGYGWKARLAERFGVKTAILSNWIRRGLSKRQIETVVKMGYPKEKWLVQEENNEDHGAIKPHVVYSGTPKRVSHADIIDQFKDKERALEINLELLQIERLDQDSVDHVLSYLRGIRETLERVKKNRDRT